MPGSPPDSSDSPLPSATPSSEGAPCPPASETRYGSIPGLADGAIRPLSWRTNLGLFAATVASAFLTYFGLYAPGHGRTAAFQAAQFTGALLGILLAHEFGHFIAARIHKVDASLPYFIPLPLVSPFGTMGAVIRMRSIIPTRRALLDIGASGPLAGLALAIPLYAWGAAHSQIVALDSLEGGMQLGNSLLLRMIDRWCAPPVSPGTDLLLSPVAFAAWGGMFVTMINLIPVSQLDGGHVAFALFGTRQNRIAMWVHRSMLVLFLVSLTSFLFRDVRAGLGLWHLGRHVYNSVHWLAWFEMFAILGALTSRRRASDASSTPLGIRTRVIATLGLTLLAGTLHDSHSVIVWTAWFAGVAMLLIMEARWGALHPSSALLDHPPTGLAPLNFGRSVVAIVTLIFFALLFMPTPFIL
jgi:membrane-associated protease RseP (regulator of RpoE activity)